MLLCVHSFGGRPRFSLCLSAVWGEDPVARSRVTIAEVLAGNVPSWLRTSSLAELRSGDGASVVPFQVTLDSLAIGFDGDYFLTPPSLPGPPVSHRLRRSRFPCMLARSRAIARHPRARHAPHNPVSTSC